MRHWVPVVLALGTSCAAVPRARAGGGVDAIRTDLLPGQAVEHVLNRLAYGPRPGDLEKVRRSGIERWIAHQLHPEQIDDHATDSLLSGFRTLTLPTRGLTAAFREVRAARRDSGGRAVGPSRQTLQSALREVGAARLVRAVSTDFRSVFAEVVSRHLGATALDRIFPGFVPSALGVV